MIQVERDALLAGIELTEIGHCDRSRIGARRRIYRLLAVRF